MRFNRSLQICLYLLSMCLGACPTLGQVPGASSAELSDSFETVFSMLSHQCQIGIVCEGAPVKQQLTTDRAKILDASLMDAALTNDTKVKAAAKCFDYDVWTLDKGIFVLTKRFSESGDLPEVSLEELQSAAHNILKATEPFNHHAFAAPLVLGDLLKDDSPDELAQLKAGIAIGALSPGKQEIARKLALLPLGSPLDMIERVEARLIGVKKRATYLHYFSYENTTYPAYTGPVGSQGTIMLVVLGSVVHTDIGGMTLKFGESDKGESDPTTPDSVATTPQPSPSVRKSLAELAQAWTALPDPGDKTQVFQVDPIVANKTVSVFGEDRLTHDSIRRAVEYIYGVVSIPLSETTLRITLPSSRPLRQLSEIPDTVRRLIPPAFLRLIENQKTLDEAVVKGRIASIKRRELPVQEPKVNNLADRLYISSVKRLRTMVEPLLKASARKRLPLKAIGAEAHDLIAISTMASALMYFHSLLDLPIAMLQSTDSAVVRVESDGININFNLSVSFGEGKEKKYSEFSGSTILPAHP